MFNLFAFEKRKINFRPLISRNVASKRFQFQFQLFKYLHLLANQFQNQSNQEKKRERENSLDRNSSLISKRHRPFQNCCYATTTRVIESIEQTLATCCLSREIDNGLNCCPVGNSSSCNRNRCCIRHGRVDFNDRYFANEPRRSTLQAFDRFIERWIHDHHHDFLLLVFFFFFLFRSSNWF